MCIYFIMRRKAGELLPFEQEIIRAAKHLRANGVDEFYGFQISKQIEDERHGRHTKIPKGLRRVIFTVGFGTLYRALDRLQKMGVLSCRWEELPPGESRPRRRYYKLRAPVLWQQYE